MPGTSKFIVVSVVALLALAVAPWVGGTPVASAEPHHLGAFRPLPLAAPTGLETPERVLLLGDSLGASIEPALKERFGSEGIEFFYTGFPGTGPLSYQGTFWRDVLVEKIAIHSPDLVIIQASGNYNIGGEDPFTSTDGSALEHGSRDFFEVWEQHMLDLVELSEASGAAAMVATAPMVDRTATSHPESQRHNEGYVRLVRKTGAAMLDWNLLLAPDGEYQHTIEIGYAKVELRAADGLHFAETAFPVVADWVVDEVCRPHDGSNVA